MMTRKYPFVSVVAVILVLSGAVRAAEAEAPTILVVPARYTIVQLSFDIAGVRSVFLVSYGGDSGSVARPMHIWDSKTRKWVETNIEEYSTADIFETTPQRIILVGSDEDLPSVLVEASFWCPDVKRIPTLNIVTLVNTLNESLKFTPREWKWLAKRYKLKLKDLNAERRRYGKYGKPGEKTKVPMPMAPATIKAGEPEPEWGKALPEDK